MRTTIKRFILLNLLSALACGCAEEDSCQEKMCEMRDIVATRAPLNAYCSIVVANKGTVDMETDYVPNVTCCENGGAPEQALRSQAVAARSVAYHNLGGGKGTASNPIGDSQAVQVYSCNGRADSRLGLCKAAANDTSGMILRYKNTTLCAFYVSGSKNTCLNDKCIDKGDTSASCYTWQQKYVTYNEGKSGDNVTQSSQGWVNPKNYANRGTMSQNGASCLASKRGYNWVKIVKFFYGSDIDIVKTTGSCVQAAASIPGENANTEVKCETTLSKSGTIIDDKDPCFSRSSVESWYEEAKGHAGHLYFTYGWANPAEAIGKWTVNVTRPGLYEVQAYIDSSVAKGGDSMTSKAPYVIRASGSEHKVTLDMSQKNGWVSLGKFNFAKGGDQWIKLSDATGETYVQTAKKVIVFDAIKFVDAVTCTNQCTAKDELQCDGNGYKKCGDFNGDGCLEWSNITACPNDTTCKNGVCIPDEKPPQCTDDCQKIGDKECVSEGSYHTCGSFDDDSCLDWSELSHCNPDQKCKNGECVADDNPSCQHECIEGETRCTDETTYTVCGFFGDDACRHFSPNKNCDENEICRFGACIPNASSSGSKSCILAIDGRESTIIDELDPCFERSNVVWSQLSTYGYDDHLFYATVNTSGTNNAIGTWHLNVTKPGKYTIRAYVEYGIGNVVDSAQYSVMASGSLHKATISNVDQSGWVTLGTYDLAEGTEQYVKLSDDSFTSSASNGQRFVFDAIKIEPYKPGDELPPTTDDQNPDNPSVSTSSSDCAATPRHAKTPGAALIALTLGLSFALRRRKSPPIAHR